MKNRKLVTIIPLFLVLCGVIVVSAFGVSYSASNGYYYIRRNMFSHHYVSNNGKESDGVRTASGTILIKNGTRTSKTNGTAAAVYCAQQGASNSASAHTKKALSSVKTSLVSATAKNKLNALMQYAYPYTTLTELKNALKDPSIGIGAETYSKYNFDNLDAQESMTAVQASIWNAIKNTTKYTYGGKLKKISSRQTSFKLFGSINWQSCSGYNTGSNRYATILNSEEKAWYNESKCSSSGNFYKYVFNVKNDGLSKNRVNTLITWYASLASKITSNNNIAPNITIKSSHFQTSGDTLTLEVTIDSEGKDYTVAFYDQSGNNVKESQKVTGSPDGNTFTITGLPLATTSVTAKATITGINKSVYYYEGGGQDWIGVDTATDSTEVSLPILNNGTGQITVYKVADQDVNVEVTYNQSDNKCGASGCLEGAYFVLYSDDKETVLKEFVTDESSFTITGLPDGTYYLYEQDPPFGYTRYDYTGENVDAEGYIKIVISGGNMASVLVNNDLIKVCFKKIDSVTKQIVDGAVFSVQDAEGSVYEEFTTSSQQGEYCLAERQLDSGYYYLEEEQAPANYVKTDKIFKFAVGKFNPEDIVTELEGDDVVLLPTNNNVVTIENKPGIVITKSDLVTGGCVEGANLTVKDSEGKTVDEWVSTCEEGKDEHVVQLNPGKYTLVEEVTPEGYATAESIEFTIDENGRASASLDMKDAPIEACFIKVSADVAEGLMGAEFEIYREDGTLYNKFVSDAVETCFQYMPVGKYKLREVKAPEGYKKLDKDIEITIKDTAETQTFEIENEVEVPKTSLDYSQIVLIISSIFMIFGLGTVGYYVYKKQS